MDEERVRRNLGEDQGYSGGKDTSLHGMNGDSPASDTVAPERTVIVGIRRHRQNAREAKDAMHELEELVKAAGGVVERSVLCQVARVHPGTFIGSGKVEMIKKTADEVSADLVVFDEGLSPGQQRNLERAFDTRVIDRTGVILDIFARRASTREGKIQVELAQLEYTLPRLTHMWAHLSRLGAGIGTRGPGETQLEVDRRRIRHRIDALRRSLRQVRNRRRVQRSARKRRGLFTVAIVGYTNAGKSTLLNRLTGASVKVMDQVFATLMPTIRALKLPGGDLVVLSDTVGFISKLPHQLIEAFKATLEEVVEADLLMHVIDTAAENREHRIKEVERVLAEIGAGEKPILHVYNKIDLIPGLKPGVMEASEPGEIRDVAVSAVTGEGLETLKDQLAVYRSAFRKTACFAVPYSKQDVAAAIRRSGVVRTIGYTDTHIEIKAAVPIHTLQRYEKYIREMENHDSIH